MPDLCQADLCNTLLRALDPASFALIAPHLSPVELPKRHQIATAFKPLDRAYFFEKGLGSVIAVTSTGLQAEVGMIGREGFAGIAIVLGGRNSPFDIFMQAPGNALSIAAPTLLQLIEECTALRRVLLDYIYAFLIQISQTAVATASMTVRERLARWMLMSHDRVDGDELPMTHEFLSLMLTVRRPGITEAVQALEATGAIAASRGLIKIRSRDLLIEMAGGSYGVPEAEYQKLVAA